MKPCAPVVPLLRLRPPARRRPRLGLAAVAGVLFAATTAAGFVAEAWPATALQIVAGLGSAWLLLRAFGRMS